VQVRGGKGFGCCPADRPADFCSCEVDEINYVNKALL
jgi:hypothetical protein